MKHITVISGVMFIALLGSVQMYHAFASEPTVTPQAVIQAPITHPEASEVFTLVNAQRVKYGLSPLVDDPRLDASATAKCEAMQQLNVWSHDLPDGRTPQTFINKEYASYSHSSENLTWGWNTSESVVDHWMNSAPHRAAILSSSYTNVGYAVCDAKDYPNIVVQHFIAQ